MYYLAAPPGEEDDDYDGEQVTGFGAWRSPVLLRPVELPSPRIRWTTRFPQQQTYNDDVEMQVGRFWFFNQLLVVGWLAGWLASWLVGWLVLSWWSCGIDSVLDAHRVWYREGQLYWALKLLVKSDKTPGIY